MKHVERCFHIFNNNITLYTAHWRKWSEPISATKTSSNCPFYFYLFDFIGDGSVCSTTSSNDNGGDVDAFLLQVIKMFSLINYIICIRLHKPFSIFFIFQNSPHHSIVQYPAFQYEGNNSVSANSLNNTPIASRKNLIDYKVSFINILIIHYTNIFLNFFRHVL